MENKIIVHVSEGGISPSSGMGKISWHWKKALENRGYTFINIGREEAKSLRYWTFPCAAKKFYLKLNLKASLFLVHEPASYAFLNLGVPTILFSHGVETRGWKIQKTYEEISLRSRLTFPLLRLKYANKGLRKSNGLLLTNFQDIDFVKSKFKRNDKDIMCFRNGYEPFQMDSEYNEISNELFTVLFNASWIKRKGIQTLVDAASILEDKKIKVQWLLAGTGKSSEEVLNSWPIQLRPNVKIIPKFDPAYEHKILKDSSIFVLPSFFEGQPLSLIQAMAAGKCCITTDACGQKDLIKHRSNGLLFNAGDSEQLAVLIEEIYFNQAFKKTLGDKARASVIDRTWHTTRDEVANFIESYIK